MQDNSEQTTAHFLRVAASFNPSFNPSFERTSREKPREAAQFIR